MPYTPETDRYPRRPPAPPDLTRPPDYHTPDDDEGPDYPIPYDDEPRPPLVPEPPEPQPDETAMLHGGRVLTYVLEHGRIAVWQSPDVSLERALAFSLIAMSAPDMIDRARDRIVEARRLMSAELHTREQTAAREAQEAARLALAPGPRSPFPGQPGQPGTGSDGDGGRGALLLPRPRINPPAGTAIDHLQF